MEAEYRYAVSQKVSIITLIANLLLAGAKISVGILFNSQALLADGLHSGSDVISTITVMVGNWISKEPPDEEHPYGHGKAESIASKVLGISLILGGFIIFKKACEVIINGNILVPGNLVIWTAMISILIKELMYHYTYRTGKRINNKALIADAFHHRTDAFSSIAALLGAGGAKLGYPILDPIAGMIVAIFIFKMGIEVFKDAANDLMDAAPRREKLNEVSRIICSIEEVVEIRNLKMRTHGPKYCIDVRVVVDNGLSVVEGHEIAVKVREKVHSQSDNIQEILVHIDPEKVSNM